VHLLPQRADAADLVMPSKLTGMLASGRAVLATAQPETELCGVVEDAAACGLVVPPENPAAMADALRALAADPARRAALGANGRRYAEAELGRDVILRRFEAQLLTLARQRQPQTHQAGVMKTPAGSPSMSAPTGAEKGGAPCTKNSP
jgi:colanic acid biosynthesis glycosyl transferase WcaI